MDIVGALSYCGQDLCFFDELHYAYVTGRSICTVDVTKGPRDIIWRQNSGIGKITTHFETHRVAIAPITMGSAIEVIDFPAQNNVAQLKNPSEARVIDMSFSKSGDRLFALSDVLDHKAFAWDMSTRQLIFVSDISGQFLRIFVNPAESATFILLGDSTMSIGTVFEVMNNTSVKLNSSITSSRDEASLENGSYRKPTAESPQQESLPQNSLTFAVWAPGNRVFMGNRNGSIYEWSASRDSLRCFAKLFHGEEDVSPFPSCGNLTTNHLIVGTSHGGIHWYTLADTVATSDLNDPVQSALVGGYVSCLVTDPSYSSIFVGTRSGTISKLALDVADLKKEENDEDNADGNEQTHNIDEVEGPRHLKAENIASLQAGAVISCRSFFLPILSTSENITKSSATYSSFFVTGCHLGTLSFWKQPAIDSEPIGRDINSSALPGIRRSTPRAVRTVSKITVLNEQGIRPIAVTSVEFLPFHSKSGHCLMLLGTLDGWFETWRLCAYDTEEEEDREDGDAGEADDEDEGVVKLCMSKVFRQKLFTSSLSFVSASREENKFFNVAVGSPGDKNVLVMKIPADFTFNPNVSFCIELQEVPTALCWSVHTLWVGSATGNLSSFFPSRNQKGDGDFCPPNATWDTELPSVNGLVVNRGDFLIVTSCERMSLRVIPLPSETALASIINSSPPNKLISFQDATVDSTFHTDVVICSTISPNGSYFAAGCGDGSIHIWTVGGQSLKIVNRVQLHATSVISLSFSADASLLLSCGADGSCFISTIDEPTRSHLKAALGDSKYFERVSSTDDPFPHTAAEDSSSPDGGTWIERKNVDMLQNMRSSCTQKLSEMTAAVEDVSLRLHILLDRNESRNEIEKMDRADFVVDLQRRDEIVRSNELSTIAAKDRYTSRNLWNELVAARIRHRCWDSMETQMMRVRPFLSEGREDFRFVSSYSVQKSSDDYLRRLGIAKRLRGIELRSLRAHGFGVAQKLSVGSTRTAWLSSIFGCPQTVSWIANDGIRWPSRDITVIQHRGEKGDPVDTSKEKDADKKDASSGQHPHEAAPSLFGPPGGNAVEDDDDQSLTSLDGDYDVDDTDIFNLLYPPQVVRTQIQKRNQITFLTEVTRLLRTKFNEFLNDLAREREDVVTSIDARNARIKVIQEELHLHEDSFQSVRTEQERASNMIEVSDDELVHRPYESEAMLLARLKEDEDRRRYDTDKGDEDISGRALQEMMNGTLEVKRDVLAEVTALHRPAWMDELSPADMNELQLKEIEAFEVKMKSMQEEQVKYRKGLEQELKKLKNEYVDACRGYDEKLMGAAKLKIAIQRELSTQELYIARLSLSIAKRDQVWATSKKVEQEITSAKLRKADMRTNNLKFHAYVDSMRLRLSALQEEERSLDRTFKRDLQTMCNTTFAQDDLKVFTQLYRLRSYPTMLDDDGSFELDPDESEFPANGGGQSLSRSRMSGSKGKTRGHGSSKKGMGSSSAANDHQQSKKAASKMMKMSKGRSSVGGKDRLGPMQEAARALKNVDQPQVFDKDPFFAAMLQKDKAKRIAEAQIPLLIPISIDSDCPEGFKDNVTNFTWAKLQDLRNARIEKEIEAKQLSIEYSELKKKVDEISGDEVALDELIANLKGSLEGSRKLLHSLDANLEVVVSLRQGQDEVDHEEAVTEYRDAVLVPTGVVHKFNSRIKELGKEKIGVLSRIKQFRRKINLVDWEARHLSLEARHFEEYFTDLQLLRVTRELQHVIRDGADSEQTKDRLERIAARKEFMVKEADTRAHKLQKANDALRRQLLERTEESSSLENKIRELRVQLVARKSVKQSRDEARGIGGDPISVAALKMKKVVARRQLVDAARIQGEEIDFLHREVDRLRQKTFPSFVKAARTRYQSTQDDRR